MFGMGFSEIIVILVVALIFLGPEKLPEAAKSISKGIRDLRKQSRDLQNQIESDEHIGGAIRDLRSALRGEEPRSPPPKAKAKAQPPPIPGDKSILPPPTPRRDGNGDLIAEHPAQPDLRLPPVAGEIDDSPANEEDPGRSLGGLVRPAPGAVAKGSGADSDHG